MTKLVLVFGCMMLFDCGHSHTMDTSPQRSEIPRNSVAQNDSPRSSDVLLKISFDGGFAPDKSKGSRGHIGHSEFVITRDGKYSFSGDVEPKAKGVLSKLELDELVEQINTSDFVALKSKKFTGDCPTTYDGVEATYTFYTLKGVEVIASCKVDIDKKSPLFLKVWEIQEKYKN